MPSLAHRLSALALTGAALLTGSAPALAASRHASHRAHSAAACTNANTLVSAASAQVVKAAVVCLINQERTSHGLPALRADARLDRSAQQWTDTLVSTGQFTHGSDFAARISAVGFDWSWAGENIATGFSTPQQVVTGWMHSTGHCRNILDPDYASVGTGMVARVVAPYGSSGATWAQDFATPMGARTPSTNWKAANAVC